MALSAIIQVVGAPGSGQSTVAHLLAATLSPVSVLHVMLDEPSVLADVSGDTVDTAAVPAIPTVMSAISALQTAGATVSTHRETIDWAFSELVQADPSGGGGDCLRIGALPEPQADPLSEASQKVLAFGFQRLLDAYTVVIMDGYHPELFTLLLEAGNLLQVLLVATPASVPDIAPFAHGRLPAVVVNRISATDDAYPDALQQWLANGQARLVGRFPECPAGTDPMIELVSAFADCLYRLDLGGVHPHR